MPEASNPSTKARHTAGALSTDIIPENSQKINTFDKNSSEFSSNSRRALPETADAELSEVGIGEGKKRKIIADYTRSIVYSRKAFVDTLKAIPGGLDLKSETFKKYVDKVWENANTLTTHKEKFNFAHDIAVQIADSIISEGTAENPDAIEAKDRLAHLRSGIGRLTFSKTDISDGKNGKKQKKATLSFTTEQTTECGEEIRDKGCFFVSILKMCFKFQLVYRKADRDTKKLYVRNSLKNQPYA